MMNWQMMLKDYGFQFDGTTRWWWKAVDLREDKTDHLENEIVIFASREVRWRSGKIPKHVPSVSFRVRIRRNLETLTLASKDVSIEELEAGTVEEAVQDLFKQAFDSLSPVLSRVGEAAVTGAV